MSMQFTKATKRAARLRLALIGPAGSGKTYTALTVGKHLGGRVAVIDTERGSASKYADLFEFDVLELSTFAPQTYVQAIQAAEQAGYDVLIIDSLSHAWVGKGGALEMHDNAVDRQRGSKNTYTAWRDVTPHHMALVDAMLQSKCHVVATVRAKQDYVQEKDPTTGKTVIRKVGLAPVQRDGLEYEFDVVGDMDADNTLAVSKTRCNALSGAVIRKPGQEFADTLKAWLSDGAAPEPPKQLPTPPKHQGPPATNGNGHAEDPNFPKNGAELYERLKAKDASLEKEKVCRAGAFLQHVREKGLAQGYSDDIRSWNEKEQIQFAVAVVKAFLAKPTPESSADGVRLVAYLRDEGKKLHAQEGCANEYELLEKVQAWGAAKGWGTDETKWQGEQLVDAKVYADAWLAERWQAVRDRAGEVAV